MPRPSFTSRMVESIAAPMDATSTQIVQLLEQVLETVTESRHAIQGEQAKILRLLEDIGDDSCSPKKDTTRTVSIGSKLSQLEEEMLFTNSEDTQVAHLKGSLTQHLEESQELSVGFNPRNSAMIRAAQTAARKGTTTFRSLEVTWSIIGLWLRAVVRSSRFDFSWGIVIFINSIYIGIQIEGSIHMASDEDTTAAEYGFLLAYSVELLLRLWAFGVKEALRNGWNRLDLLLVLLGSISLFVIAPISRHMDLGEGVQYLQQITLLRLLRLLRLVRSLRLLQQFRILWGLVNGLFHALPTILSTFTLLCLLIYIFACGGVELITKSNVVQSAAREDPSLQRILDTHFHTLPMVALTLIRFATLDSIGGIYEPLVKARPVLILYFVFMLLVVSITIMNLITAVLVEHSITMAKTDSDLEHHQKKKRIRQLIPKVEDLFAKLDCNQDGYLTLFEATRSSGKIPLELEKVITNDTLYDLYDALDRDHSGAVDKEEFVAGIIDLALSDVPIETLKMLHHCRHQKKQLRQINRLLRSLEDHFATLRHQEPADISQKIDDLRCYLASWISSDSSRVLIL